MIEKIIGILCEIKRNNGLKETLNGSSQIMKELKLDSLQIMKFMMKIEDEFDIEIDFKKFNLLQLNTIESVCKFVEEALSGKRIRS